MASVMVKLSSFLIASPSAASMRRCCREALLSRIAEPEKEGWLMAVAL